MSVGSIIDKSTGKINPAYIPDYTPAVDHVRTYTFRTNGAIVSPIPIGAPQLVTAFTNPNPVFIPDEGYTHLKCDIVVNINNVVFSFSDPDVDARPPQTLQAVGFVDNDGVIGSEFLYMGAGTQKRYCNFTLQCVNVATKEYAGTMSYTDVMAYSSADLTEMNLQLGLNQPLYKIVTGGTVSAFAGTVTANTEQSYVDALITWTPCHYVSPS